LNDTSVVINDTTPVMERHDRCHTDKVIY